MDLFFYITQDYTRLKCSGNFFLTTVDTKNKQYEFAQLYMGQLFYIRHCSGKMSEIQKAMRLLNIEAFKKMYLKTKIE